eukprot:m.172696 g.172696  ORF g.172696 m.172696 type:complete len:61 (+) comp39085_c0_seq7:253-435(+)
MLDLKAVTASIQRTLDVKPDTKHLFYITLTLIISEVIYCSVDWRFHSLGLGVMPTAGKRE